MNHYEAKQEAKRERLERAADNAQQRSQAAFDSAHRATDGIPFGQPILVGHHSERRHRRAIQRADDGMRKGIDEGKKASDLSSRAAGVGQGGISADDPDAVQKLREKITELEARHARMVAVNKAHRKFLKNPTSLDGSDLDDEAKAMIRLYKPAYSWEPNPFPPYALQNSNGNLRRYRERLEALETEPVPVDPDEYGDESAETLTIGLATIENHPPINRVRVLFPSRISKDACRIMKQHGFRWAPSATAWQRQRNNSHPWLANERAKQAAEQIEKLPNGGREVA